MKLIDCFKRVFADFVPVADRFYTVRFTFISEEKHCFKHVTGLFSDLEIALESLRSMSVSNILVEYLGEVDSRFVAICIPCEVIDDEKVCD